jgi:hypothetical protein
MIEWLALILLVPAILFPIVLLFGFAGCNQIYGLDPVRARENAFETTLGQDRGRANRCIVQRIEAARLTANGSAVQITVQRPESGILHINSLFVSQAANDTDPAADPYDSAADLTPMPGMPLVLTPDPAQPLVELPEFAYDLDSDRALLIAFDVGEEGRVPRTDATLPDFEATAFLGPLPPPPPGVPVHEASLPNRQPGYESEARVYLVQRIDAISS